MVMDAGGYIRASDAEREAVVDRLRAAATEGRLTLEEFSDRTSRVYSSRTRDELAVLVDDLPLPQAPSPTPAPPQVVGPTERNGTLPLLALIFGLISLPAVGCTPLGAGTAVASIVLGILGLRSAREGATGDRRMAIAGIVCGGVGIALQAVLLIVLGAFGIG